MPSDRSPTEAATRISLNGWRAWLAFGGAIAFVCFQLILQTFPSVMREGLTVSLALDGAGFGGLSASFYYPYILLQVPSGLLVAKFGPKRLLLVGAILCAAASFWFAITQTVWTAEMARMTMGIGAGPTVVCAMTLAARWFPRRQFPVLVAVVELSGMIGAAIGQEILGWGVEVVGWRITMASCGLAALALAGLMAIAVRDWPWRHSQSEGSDPPPASMRAALVLLMKPRLLLLAFSGGLVAVAGITFGMLWAVPFFQETAKFPLQKAAFVSSFYFWGCLPGMLIFASACKRYGHPARWLGLGALLSALLLAAILFSPPSQVRLSVLMALLGFFNAAYSLTFTLVEQEAPEGLRGVALGLANMMVMGVGALIFQPLLGYLASRQSLEAPDAWILSILVLAELVGVVILFFLHADSKRRAAEPTL